MPDQQPSLVSSGPPADWLSDAPGGDVPFSDLWPADDGTNQPAQATPAPAPAAQPQAAPTAEEFVIKTSTGTVYRTLEDAAKGTEEKDRYIEQLKAENATLKGTAPHATTSPQQPQTAGTVEEQVQARAKELYTKLSEAVSKNDPVAFANAWQQMTYDALAPVAPLMGDFAKQRAFNVVSQDAPDFNQFVKSPQYQEVLTQHPKLKAAIELGESDLRFAGELPEFYSLAYWASQGRRVSEQVKTAQVNQPRQTPQVRPTTQTMTPNAPVVSSVTPGLESKEGRQQIIKDGEARGIENRFFEVFPGR